MRDFRQIINKCNFRDLGFQGPKFTWCNNRSGEECIRERLDRALITMDWSLMFPLALVEHLVCSASDHLPILVVTDGNGVVSGWRKKHVRFEAMWVRSEECEQVIQEGWSTMGLGSAMYCVSEKIKTTRQKLSAWNFSKFGNVNRQLKQLMEQLRAVKQGPSNALAVGEEKRIMQQMDEILSREEIIWRQRSWVAWLKEG
ncbi:hypothetical protein L1049_020483 [Liquidambar formosana]|uniref:Reverse transcriptase n=1 Tax=Liquidambar formosana TaxID=63359 RepID=A0AAP0XAS3_LIQFO